MLRKTLPFIIAMLLVCFGIKAQHHQVIQFFVFDNLILLPSFVEGKEGFLILDSGAEGLALNKRYFNDDQNYKDNIMAMGFNGQVEKVLSRNTQLQIKDFQWENVKALVFDLEHLKPAADFPILGLAGFQFFEDYEISLDFSTNHLILFELDKKGNVLDSNNQFSSFDFSFPIKLKGHIPSVEVKIKDTELRLGLDTGSGMSLIHPKFKSDLSSQLKPIKQVQLQATDQKIKQARLWRLEGLHISMFPCAPIHIAFVNINRFNNILSGPRIDGVLGMDFFLQFTCSINLKKKEMRVWMEASAEQLVSK